ncbi:MAG: GNAT family N-acetyltransferase [Mesorhizobium sp.]|nr:MAG: GNAT family N-acetyltransferase [Mesorhizobium sp.]
MALDLARETGCRYAVLTDGSPSCGSSFIYDGSFSRARVAGQGTTTALLEENGIRVCLYFPIFSTWMGRPGVYVQDLYVEDRFRGRRIGEKLLRRVAKECRAAGGVYLRLSVDTDNETAKAFYEKLGIGRSSYEQVQKIVGDAFFAFADAPEE